MEKARITVYDLGIKARSKWEFYRLLSIEENVYLSLKV